MYACMHYYMICFNAVNARFDLQSIEVSGTLKRPEGQTMGNIGLDDYDYVQDQYAATDPHPATSTVSQCVVLPKYSSKIRLAVLL